MAGTKHDAELFVERWRGRGNEDQDTQLFWIGFFQDVLGLTDALDRLKFEQPVHTAASDHQGFIDVLIPTAKTIVEQKSLGIDLSKPEMRQGRPVTPAQQALGYVGGMALSQKPRYIVACNFSEFWVYDTETDPLCKGEPLKVSLEDIPNNLPVIQFLAGKGEAPEIIQRKVDVEAGRIMGRIHDAVAESFESAGFDRNDESVHHAISAFCTRVMFLMFCEDQDGLIPNNAFQNYVQHYQAPDLRKALLDLFEWLDTPDAERDPFASDLLKAFPYMNGGLFAERTQIPTLNETVRTTIIVEGCQEFDWAGVNPTVFGSIFEGSLSHDERRSGGMHYTSPENIHKVIDPLFLDVLEREFLDACARPESGGARTKALDQLHEKIGSISILDPACGSGNFLTESYMCLRRLENRIFYELSKDGQAMLDIETEGMDSMVKVNLGNFHGIEINDFACAVAKTALWIAEKQADTDTSNIVQRVHDELPLTDYGTIHQGNALRMDWNDVVPASECTYICGNPPFIGSSMCTTQQKQEVVDLFGRIKLSNSIDYVAGWFYKAAEMISLNHGIGAALVSTNSITQGEQVSPIWKTLTDRFGIHISFAHKTFYWASEASDPAHVHCVIIGFRAGPNEGGMIFDGNGTVEAANISPYLIDAPTVFVESRGKPLCDVPRVTKGNQPSDGGNLILTDEEKNNLLKTDPKIEPFIRKYIGSVEFIHGSFRWCLWLKDAEPSLLLECKNTLQRVQAVRDFRAASSAAPTRKAAERPTRFFSETQPDDDYIVIPRVSSYRRKYIPMGILPPTVVASDGVSISPHASLYRFGILQSQFHNAWMRTVCGRLKSDYRYSGAVVYNTFVWPAQSEAQDALVGECAKKVLSAREGYGACDLSQMYDPNNEALFPELFRAHRELDAAVEAAYGVDFGGDEEKIVAHLFKLYAAATADESA